MKNQLRIIGGEWKRRSLPFASIEGLRPTPDRVRETLFNWLMWDIQNAQVLDLCSGSGALGFEALSRGAAKVVMIEPNPTQARFLKDNIQLLKAENCQLVVSTAQQALNKLNGGFDVVFLDPPYSLDLWQELAELGCRNIPHQPDRADRCGRGRCALWQGFLSTLPASAAFCCRQIFEYR